MDFLCITYMFTPFRNTCPGNHGIYNVGRPLLSHHFYLYILSKFYLCEGVKKKKYINFTLFTPKLSLAGRREKSINEIMAANH